MSRSLLQLGLSGVFQASLLSYMQDNDLSSLLKLSPSKLKVAIQQIVATAILPMFVDRFLPMILPQATVDQVNQWVDAFRPIATGLMYLIIDSAVQMKIPSIRRALVVTLSSAASELAAEKVVGFGSLSPLSF